MKAGTTDLFLNSGGDMQKRQDEALLTAFHLMDADERDFFLGTAQAMTAERTLKPRLSLVVGGASLPRPEPLRSQLG